MEDRARLEPLSPRRAFLAGLLTVAAGLVAWKGRPAWAKKLGLALDRAPKLQQVGGWVVLMIKGKPVLLIRDTEKTIRALNPTCTHQKCLVEFNPRDSLIHCPCHKSAYSLEGKVLDGPAPAPLQVYSASLAGEQIVLDLPE